MRFPLNELSTKNGFIHLDESLFENNCQIFHKHVEVDFKQGYFPIGAGGTWHGGVHLHAPEKSLIYPIADGCIVACRLGKRQNLKYGSNNFILVSHAVAGMIYFSLYYHLKWNEENADDDFYSHFTWLQDENGVVDQSLVIELKNGHVMKPNRAVSMNEPIWEIGEYGSAKFRSCVLHWEVFSVDKILPDDVCKFRDGIPEGEYVFDVEKAATRFPGLEDINKNGVFDSEELMAYFDAQKDCIALRNQAYLFTSEFSHDWDTTVDEMTKGTIWPLRQVDKLRLASNITPYNFWKDILGAFGIPHNAMVWHYNPVWFVEVLDDAFVERRLDLTGFDRDKYSWPQTRALAAVANCFKLASDGAKALLKGKDSELLDYTQAIGVVKYYGLSNIQKKYHDDDDKAEQQDVDVDKERSESGLAYIQLCIDSGYPALIGVNVSEPWDDQVRTNHGGVTDHFVFVYGYRSSFGLMKEFFAFDNSTGGGHDCVFKIEGDKKAVKRALPLLDGYTRYSFQLDQIRIWKAIPPTNVKGVGALCDSKLQK